jgi:hypothetical protein
VRSTLSEKAKQLLTTVQTDRAAISDARKAAVAALAAARKKLAGDLKSMHSALSKLRSKKA